MKKSKIVITGGPGTGKSSLITQLESQGYACLPEISREIIIEAKKKGIDQLFLKNPLLFSQKLLEGRMEQFQQASKLKSPTIFLDRGIPDVIAYMNYFHTSYPAEFLKACKNYQYRYIFFLPPWESIYKSDNERYESFAEAQKISKYLWDTYSQLGYQPIKVPKASIVERCQFIIDKVEE